MQYVKNELQSIFKEEVTYTVETNGLYYVYNYRLSANKFVILTLKLSEEQFILELLMLPSDKRKQGIGSRITNSLKKWAYQNNYHRINLLAIHNSKEFWRKHSFTEHPNSLQMKFDVNKKTFQ